MYDMSYKLFCNVPSEIKRFISDFNTLRTGDADLRLYITTVQDG